MNAHAMNDRRHISLSLTLILLGTILAERAGAHSGPPFPILTDQRIPGYDVTIWADPDIGEALIYVVLEPENSSEPPMITGVDMSVRPLSGRLPEAIYKTKKTTARQHVRFTANPHFDSREMWTVGVDIRLADDTHYVMSTEVEATPPGLGPIDLFVYLTPFVLFGGLWVMAFRRRLPRRSHRKAPSERRTDAGGSTASRQSSPLETNLVEP